MSLLAPMCCAKCRGQLQIVCPNACAGAEDALSGITISPAPVSARYPASAGVERTPGKIRRLRTRETVIELLQRRRAANQSPMKPIEIAAAIGDPGPLGTARVSAMCVVLEREGRLTKTIPPGRLKGALYAFVA